MAKGPMRRWCVRCAVAGCALLVAGCGGAAPGHAAKPTPPSATAPAASQVKAPAAKAAPAKAAPGLTDVTFMTTFIPTANDLPWYLAMAKGYFKQDGLNVKISTGKGAVATAEQVAAGDVEIAQTDLSAMALGRAKGESLEAFFVETPKSSFGVFASKAEGIRHFAGLKGRSVLSASGSDADFLLPPIMKQVGVKMSQVHIIAVPPSQTWTDYIGGKADAVVADLAADAPLIQPRRPSNPLYFSRRLNVLYLGLVSRPAYIKAHPKVIRAFTKATQQAMHDLLAHPRSAVPEAVRYVVKTYPGAKAAVLTNAWKAYAAFTSVPAQAGHPIGWMPPSLWHQTVAVLRKNAGFPASIRSASLYTNRFVGSGG